ncbi:uncharacterized protein LOC134969764 isoform X2 [Pseudophryne corroboree]|uniref:uncharacterized protein LOC134969764 isoform X2 n=1 Tax=Pseudophryne corroboree TaxID=495146 RepID=UPI00308160F7
MMCCHPEAGSAWPARFAGTQEMHGGSESLLTTHVLNSAQGIPARGLTLTLSKHDACHAKWVQVSRSVTNEDGRCPGLLRGEHLTADCFHHHRPKTEVPRSSPAQSIFLHHLQGELKSCCCSCADPNLVSRSNSRYFSGFL